MPQQLIYTSAPRGLKPGQYGFCTVACTGGMGERLIRALERLSYYEHKTGGPQPHIAAFRKIDVGGRSHFVFTRIVDAGADYSGRTNYLAHHLVVGRDELPADTLPADIFLYWPDWCNHWDGTPQILPQQQAITLASARPPPIPAENWRQATGFAAHAAGLLSGQEPGATRIILPESRDTLSLLVLYRESSALCPAYAWRATFSTFLQQSDNPVDFLWVGGWSSGAVGKLPRQASYDLAAQPLQIPPVPTGPQAELAEHGNRDSPIRASTATRHRARAHGGQHNRTIAQRKSRHTHTTATNLKQKAGQNTASRHGHWWAALITVLLAAGLLSAWIYHNKTIPPEPPQHTGVSRSAYTIPSPEPEPPISKPPGVTRQDDPAAIIALQPALRQSAGTRSTPLGAADFAALGISNNASHGKPDAANISYQEVPYAALLLLRPETLRIMPYTGDRVDSRDEMLVLVPADAMEFFRSNGTLHIYPLRINASGDLADIIEILSNRESAMEMAVHQSGAGRIDLLPREGEQQPVMRFRLHDQKPQMELFDPVLHAGFLITGSEPTEETHGLIAIHGGSLETPAVKTADTALMLLHADTSFFPANRVSPGTAHPADALMHHIEGLFATTPSSRWMEWSTEAGSQFLESRNTREAFNIFQRFANKNETERRQQESELNYRQILHDNKQQEAGKLDEIAVSMRDLLEQNPVLAHLTYAGSSWRSHGDSLRQWIGRQPLPLPQSYQAIATSIQRAVAQALTATLNQPTSVSAHATEFANHFYNTTLPRSLHFEISPDLDIPKNFADEIAERLQGQAWMEQVQQEMVRIKRQENSIRGLYASHSGNEAIPFDALITNVEGKISALRGEIESLQSSLRTMREQLAGTIARTRFPGGKKPVRAGWSFDSPEGIPVKVGLEFHPAEVEAIK